MQLRNLLTYSVLLAPGYRLAEDLLQYPFGLVRYRLPLLRCHVQDERFVAGREQVLGAE